MDENNENQAQAVEQEAMPVDTAGDAGTEGAVETGVQGTAQGAEDGAEAGPSKLDSFLDSISGDDQEAGKVAADSDVQGVQVGDPQDGDGGAAQVQGKPANADASAADETPEVMERELLAEVKSERGQARIKQLLSGNRALQDEFDRTKQAVDGFANMIRSTGMSQEEFTDTMRYCQLVGSGDDESLKQALAMLDAQRNAICLKLGIDAPGANPFAGHPDIEKDVADMVITPEYGRELVKLRQAQAQRQNQEQQQAVMRQEAQHRQQVLGDFQKAAWAFVQQKAASDPLFKQKEAALVAAFKSQNLAQRFNPEHPETWIPQLEMLYDVIQVAPARTAVRPQALRSRPSSLGNPQVNAPIGSVERTAQILDSLGL